MMTILIALATLALGGLVQVAIAAFFAGKLRAGQDAFTLQMATVTTSLGKFEEFRGLSERGRATMEAELREFQRAAALMSAMRDEFIALKSSNEIEHRNFKDDIDHLGRIVEGQTRQLANLSQGIGFAPVKATTKGPTDG